MSHYESVEKAHCDVQTFKLPSKAQAFWHNETYEESGTSATQVYMPVTKNIYVTFCSITSKSDNKIQEKRNQKSSSPMP